MYGIKRMIYMRKIAVVTGTRAEYGLLYWIMKKIEESELLKLQLIVTGSHLSPEFGSTYTQIEKDGFYIDSKVNMHISGDTPLSITKSMGIGMIGFADAYERLKPDLLLVLGDRYEILTAASSAVSFNIPIAHIHGGESTEGAIDEQIRHAVTKLSHLHFASTKQYADNIIRMGEEDWRVFNVGAPGLEWINKLDYYSKQQLFDELGMDFNQEVVLATFHPVTLQQENTEIYIENLLRALVDTNMQVIFTGANADPSGSIINHRVKQLCASNKKIKFFENLGQRRYLSCQKHCAMMIGNSSSGIIEAASFKIPVINIGDRQKGRLRNDNVIDAGYEYEEIRQAIKKARNPEFKNKLCHIKNLYGTGYVSSEIVKIIEEAELSRLLNKRLVFS